MRCFISYQRDNANTINEEALIVSQRYSTFDKAEMDRFEDYLKSSMGCGISVEYDIDKCIENEKGDNDAVLDKIRTKIEHEADYQDAYVNADIAKGMYLTLEILDKYKGGDNK